MYMYVHHVGVSLLLSFLFSCPFLTVLSLFSLLPDTCRYPFNDDQVVPDCEWEVFLRETAAMIITEQSPKRYCNTKAISRINLKCICLLFLRLLEVRGRYYELLTHCIPPDIIFKVTKRERGGREGEGESLN